ncbi:YadA-like family protein [Histophilus somni]|uniref:YadA-like family protein n=1 Tax=Histophilus somni TaxID=731 RepID=UPI00094B66DF|nr:YadA-like family protein [Histophilus somni]
MVGNNGNFYKVDTKYGTPIKELGSVSQDKVLVGAKGALEKEFQLNGRKFVNIGQKIRFGHLKDGEIKSDSDQAITGNQLKNVGDILGISVNTGNTKFDNPSFTAVESIGSGAGGQNTFKGAIDALITAVNKGYKFSDGTANHPNKDTPFYLGSTIEIKAGDISKSNKKTHLGKNLKTQFKPKDKKNEVAEFTIGLTDTPEFTSVKLTAAPTENTHAVNKKYVDDKLKDVASNIHFMSVHTPTTTPKTKGNYNNDGAKVEGAIAIGVDASAASENSIAMGKGSKIEAEISNAVAIGANNHLRAKAGDQKIDNTVAIGSDNIITGRKIVNLGSGNKIGNTDDNYQQVKGAGAVSIRVIGDDNKVHGVWNTVIGEGNKFTDSSVYVHLMGDKNTVTDSKNAIILGDNNIVSKLANSIIIGKNITAKSNVKNDNNLIVMGNQAQATNANNSVVIGASAKSTATSAVVIGQGAESKAQSAVVLGKGASVQANATGAVAIGEGASVSTNAGNSIALGKGSQATAKANAKANATVEGVNFAFAGGTGNNKTVLSIGKAGTERVIKHVAAGEVSKTSTDAINGSQLFSVTTEFAKLAKDVLGAELGTTGQFKKSEFKTLKATSTSTDTAQNKTFREAINANIDQINKGLVFSDGTKDGTRQLGEKITIQAGNIDSGDFVSDNIKTNYGPNTGKFLIGIKKDPRFEKVTVTKDVEDTSPEMTLTTKKYVDGKLANVAAKFTVKGDTNGTDGKGYELNKDNTELNINGDAKNITTEVDKTAKKLTVSLNSALTGITSIGKDESNKITFNGGTTITAGGAGLTLANEGDKVKISNVADGTTANDAVNKSQLDTKQDKLTGTITANNGLQITSGDGKNTVASNITLGLETGLKDKIDNALSKTEAGNTYAKVDASNINNGNQTAWRNKLDVYSKLETTNEIAKAKETVTNGAGITVTETAAGNGAKTFKVALENSYKTKIDNIGTGTVSDKNDKTVTGGKVHEAIEAAKTDIKGKLYANTATFGLKGNDSQKVTKKLDNTIEIKGTNTAKSGQTNIYVSKADDNSGLKIELGETLKGITSITKGDNKSKIEFKDDSIDLTPVDGKTVTITKEGKISGLTDGQIENASKDVVTGNQLHDLAGKLGVSVDKNSKTGFTAPLFVAVNYQGQTATNGKTTFKEAIDDLIVAVNKGLVIGDGTATGTLQLGDTLQIKAGNIDKPTSDVDGYSSDNIKTSYQSTSKELLIGIKDKPTFKEVQVSGKVEDSSDGKTLTTKEYVDAKLATKAGTFKVSSDKGDTNNITGTLSVKGKEDDANGKHQNIKTEATGSNLTIALNSDLKGISTIGKDDKAKISFNKDTAKNEIEFSLGDNTKYKFDENGLDLGGKKITALASGLGLKDADTGNGNADIIKKVLEGTLDNGSNIKSTNAVNVKDLSKVAEALVEKGLSFEGNDGSSNKVTRKLGETLKIVGKGSGANSITTTENNIKVSKNTANDGLEIGLSDTLIGIKSVGNGDNAKITLSGSNGSKDKITFKAGSSEVTLADGKFSGVSEINKEADKGALKLTENTATLESAKDKSKLELKDGEAKLESAKDGSKVELKDKAVTLESAKDNSKLELKANEATLSVGKDAGSIKVVNNGDKKIELSPENGSTVTLKKDTTNGGVQATGLSTIGKDDSNALVFKNGTGNTAELKVGGNALTFTPTNGAGNAKTVKISNVADGKIDTNSTEAITGKQLADLATHLGVNVDNGKTGFTAPSFEVIKGGTKDATSGKNGPTTFKGAIDQLITAVNGGLTFKGNDTTSPTSTTLQLGGTLTIDSSSAGSEKDITAKLEPSNGSDPKDNGKLTLTLNKATSVDENSEKVVTSKAVATKLKDYTTTADLDKGYLKVDGSNIDDNQKAFGENVGIEKINLEEDETEGTSELVQAKALVDYLKGTGEKSVKLSDSAKTQAIGEGSISIGHNAVSRNEGSIALGYNSEASNSGAISIGQGSTVLGTSSVAVGKENDVKGNFSFVLGDENKIGLNSTSSYVIGSNNEIKGYKNISIGLGNKVDGNENILLGSHIETDDTIKNAIVLGDRSIGVSNAVSVGNAVNRRKIVFVADPTDKYDAVNKNYVDELKLTYKSNSTNKQTVKLTDGLDFKKGENIEVTVAANGSIQHNLIANLLNINSISGGTDDKGAKITLDKTKKEINFNDAKLKEISEGEIEASSKEAVTGKQLSDLAGKLGVGVNKDKTKFNDLIFEYLSNVDGSFEKNPTTLKEAIDNARAKLNAGLKFSADQSANGTQNTPHYLGSTINIVRLAAPSTTGIPAPTGTPSSINIGEYKGDNLITQYTRETNGNAKIEIGFKNAPTFSKVTLSQAQTYGNSSNVGDNDLISKSYLDAALKDFKFNVEYGDKKVQIGRGDTLKFNAGLNIKVELAQNGTTQPSAVGSALASGTNSSNSGGSTVGGGNGATSAGTSGSSNMAAQGTGATVGSSTTPTTAPTNNGGSAVTSSTTSSNGAGTNGGNGTSSTASSGATPSTTTAGTASSTPSTTSNTTAVVTIGTTEDLTGLKSAEFNGDNGNTTNITGNEIVLKDQAGNAHTQTATSQIITDNTDPDKEKAVVTTAEGVTMSVVSDDQVLVNDQTAEANVLSNGKHTTEVKAGEVAIKDKSGQEIVSLKVAEGENGQDGKGATLAFAKGTDGKSGTGVITGLKDLDATADGSSAANKNYVDEKVSDLDSNRPFDFYIKEGNSYTKVIKGRDGKFYDPKDLEGAKYDGSKYTSKDGETIETSLSAEDKVIIRAEPTTAPVGMNNVASGLGLADPETDPVKAKEAQEKATALTKAVEEKVKAIGDQAKELSTTAQKVTDLTLAVSGLEMAMSAMPEGEDKKKLQTQLEENKKQLEKAKEELGKAKTALTKAQTELTKANADYEANYKGYEKVADLVKPDSQADLTNVATIADVQAVAKSGMKFKGNDGVEVRKQLSETLSITGEGTFNSDSTAAGNIKVEMAQDGNGLEVKLSDQLKNMTSFETREINGKKSVLNSNGLQASSPDSETFVNAQGTRITGKGNHAGQSASYTLDGVAITGKNGSVQLNTTALSFATTRDQAGKPVGTGVIRGLKDLDAHATGDMATNKNYVDEKVGAAVNRLDNVISTNNRTLQAGIAGANAAAALPTVTMPGKSTIALSAGTYKGRNAVAIGYSRLSDNGKITLKLQGNSNSAGDFGGGVGVGWTW